MIFIVIVYHILVDFTAKLAVIMFDFPNILEKGIELVIYLLEIILFFV